MWEVLVVQHTRATVIVPAHNEEAVLVRCLDVLLAAADAGEFDVVVVSNGSSDRTVALAREYARRSAHSVDVVDLPERSKIAALRAGTRLATAPVRVVVDADVSLDTGSLRELVERLRAAGSEPRAGCPRLVVDTTASSWPVRAYFRTWTALPYVRQGMVGSGVFAINQAGADRLGTFPDVLNDDEWVRRSFAPHERIITNGTFTMIAPRTVRALVRRTARTVVGNRELTRQDPVSANGNSPRALAEAVRQRRVGVPHAVTYLMIAVMARGLASWRTWSGHGGKWATDHTSRIS
jgi:glycosyltransferase involved in cell wall biosynthesis